MTIPERVKIGGITYDVQTVEQISSAPERVGERNTAFTRIQLRASQSKQSKEVTFLHEVIHGMGDVLGKDLDEELTEGLAQMLYQVIGDNPEMFK
ncbi:MAG: hypothetical protein WC374_04650 [Phycisphaerae bacterium]